MADETLATPRLNRTLFESGFASPEQIRAHAELVVASRRRLVGPPPDSGPGWVRVVHGANEDLLPVGGQAVGLVRRELGGLFNVAPGAEALIEGEPVAEDYTLRHGETLEFISRWGRKGVGRVWTEEEFCALFKMSKADFDAMIARGLPVHLMGDGTVRITETQVDDFLDQQAGRFERSNASIPSSLVRELSTILAEASRLVSTQGTGHESGIHHSEPGDSPYLNVEQAARYLGKTPKAIYGLLDRGKLRKMPGSHICYFTRDMLDEFLRGGHNDVRGLHPRGRKKG